MIQSFQARIRLDRFFGQSLAECNQTFVCLKILTSSLCSASIHQR